MKPRTKTWLKIGAAVALAAGGVKGSQMIRANIAERQFFDNARVVLSEKAAERQFDNPRAGISQSKSADPNALARICTIYRWNPAEPNAAAKIGLIESISSAAQVSPAKVAYALARNEIPREWHASIKQKIADLNRQADAYEQALPRLTGRGDIGRKKHVEAQIELYREETARIESILSGGDNQARQLAGELGQKAGKLKKLASREK